MSVGGFRAGRYGVESALQKDQRLLERNLVDRGREAGELVRLGTGTRRATERDTIVGSTRAGLAARQHQGDVNRGSSSVLRSADAASALRGGVSADARTITRRAPSYGNSATVVATSRAWAMVISLFPGSTSTIVTSG